MSVSAQQQQRQLRLRSSSGSSGIALLRPHAAARCACSRPHRNAATLVCRAQQQKQQQQRKSRGSSKSGDEDEDEGWRLLDASAYVRPWSVPWGAGATAGVMAAWVASFLVTAFVAAPALYTAVTRVPLRELGPAGQADFALWSELLELAVTGALLYAVTSQNKAAGAGAGEHDDGERPFNYSPARPFARGKGWLAWGLMGAAAAPAVVGAAALLLSAVGYESAVAGGRGTVDGVAGMLTVDAPTYVRLLVVTAVLAPLLEESLFRGFLLPSLTKFMPVPAAVFASSLAFGIAHLSIRDLPVLVALGCLLGFLYVRSRNLLTPMLVHGAWNGSVLTLLFALTASGVDVQELLKEAR
jgi:membrane protease YdiL (CAAX protease family)